MKKQPISSVLRSLALESFNEQSLREVAEKHLAKLVPTLIGEAFGYGTPLRKSIKQAIAESLRVGDGFNLPAYGHVVCEMVNRQLRARVAEVVAGKLSEDIEQLLNLAPKEVNLSEIYSLLIDKDADPCDCDVPGLQVVYTDYQSAWLYIDRDGSTLRNDAGRLKAHIRLLISLPKKLEDYEEGETPSGTISLGHVSGSNLKSDHTFGFGAGVRFGHWFGVEQQILAMYACGTRLILDEDNIRHEDDY